MVIAGAPLSPRDSLRGPVASSSERIPLLRDTNAVANLRHIADEVSNPKAFVVFCLFLGTVILGTAITIVPTLEIYRYVICQSYYANKGDLGVIDKFSGKLDERCSIDDISKQVAKLVGLDNLICSAGALCVVLLYGRVADQYGRKVPLWTTIIGVLVATVWTILVVNNARSWDYRLVLIGSVVAGLGGAAPALRMVSYTITCDCYSGASRIVAMSYLAASTMLPGMCAPALGSWLLERGLLWPLWGGFVLLSISLSILFFLPETHPKLQTSHIRQVIETSMTTNDENIYVTPETSKSSLVVSIVESCKESLSALALLGRGRNFVVLGLISFGCSVTQLAMIVGMQFLNRTLKWTVAKVGYYYSGYNAGKLFALLVLLPLATTYMRARMSGQKIDVWFLRFGLSFDACAFLGYGLLKSWKGLPAIVVCHILSAPLAPSLRVLISNLVSADEIGTVYAAFSVLEGVGDLAGLPVLSYIYSATLSSFAGLTFIVVAGIFFLALLTSFLLRGDDMHVKRTNEV